MFSRRTVNDAHMYDVQQLQGLLAKSKTEAPVINLAEITVQAEPQPQTRYLIVIIFINNQFELHHILMIFDSQTYIRLSSIWCDFNSDISP